MGGISKTSVVLSAWGRPNRADLQRFFSLVRVSPTGCWEWQGTLAKRTGYALIGATRAGVITQLKVHRLSYRWFVGDVPADKLVCHSCDNPPCVRPDHLFAGTSLDNNRDRHQKGRFVEKLAANLAAVNAAVRARTHCARGHELSAGNTFTPLSDKDYRCCRLCRAATGTAYRRRQGHRARRHRFLTYDGRTQTMTQWAREVGLSCSTLHLRLDYYGWTLEDALTTPSRWQASSERAEFELARALATERR